MKALIIFTFLLTSLQLSVSCQSNSKLALKEIDKVNYEIANTYCLVECSITNIGNEGIAIWIDEPGSSNEIKSYFLELHGEFSFLNLTTERILDPDNHIVYISFLKILKSGEQFKAAVLINEPDAEKINKCKRFFEEQLKYTSVKELDELIIIDDYTSLFFQSDIIVLPFEDIEF